MRWWISWYQPTQDKRPLTYPPNAAVLGWWCSGQRCDDDALTLCAWTLCAVVEATTPLSAKRAINKDWPEAKEWRFCEPTEDDFVPSDRFVKEPWQCERLGIAFDAATRPGDTK